MSGNVWGADVAQLRTLAQQFSKTADLLQQQSTQLSGQINNSPAWKGRDAEHFRSDWNGNHRTLLQQTATRLKQESKLLLKNAEEQEQASNAAPGSGGRPGPLGGPGGNWALLGGAAVVGGLRGLMGIQRNIKAPITLAKHVGQYGWVLKNQRAEAARALLTKGRHRLGGPTFDARHLTSTTKGNAALEALLKKSSEANRGLRIIDKASDIASLRNLHQYGLLSKLGPILEEKPLLGKGTGWEWLGKGGLARGLGWAGVVFSAGDAVQSFANGNIEDGLGSAFKAGLGIGSFLPPPAGTVCQVASVGIAVYENWETISSVGKNVGEGIANAVKDPGKFVSDAADTVKNAGESVAKFFSFGN